jgi:hypothetical protein
MNWAESLISRLEIYIVLAFDLTAVMRITETGMKDPM